MESGISVALSGKMYQKVLGIPEPWYIEDCNMDTNEKKQIIMLNFEKGSTFQCPKCGQMDCSVYDTHIVRKRHLAFHSYSSCIQARAPRINCPNCGVLTVELPWGRKHSGFTYEYESMIMLLAHSMSISEVCRILDENFDKIFRIVAYYVNLALKSVDCSQIATIAVDETSCKKGHKYITVVIDLKTRRVLFVTKGKDHTTIDRFKDFLKEHQGDPDNILKGCCDMSAAFIKGLNENFPNIEITFDKFHVMKMVNETIDKIRREEQKENANLLNTRMYWLKNRENLNEEDRKKFDKLLEMNLRTGKAYRFKLDLQELWKITEYSCASKFLQNWFWRATHSRITELRNLAWSIKEHWTGVLNIAGSKISNGVLEAINGSIQTLKREARGYRNTDNFITMIFLRLGKLELTDAPILRILSTVPN